MGMVIEKITAFVSVEWVMITVRLSFAIRSWCGRIQVRRAMLIRVHDDNTAAPPFLALWLRPHFRLSGSSIETSSSAMRNLALTGTGVIPAGLIQAPQF